MLFPHMRTSLHNTKAAADEAPESWGLAGAKAALLAAPSRGLAAAEVPLLPAWTGTGMAAWLSRGQPWGQASIMIGIIVTLTRCFLCLVCDVGVVTYLQAM